MEIPVYSITGEVIDHLAVDEAVLGGKPNMELIRQAVMMYEANQRVGTAKAKNRHEVSGSDHKPWPQNTRAAPARAAAPAPYGSAAASPSRRCRVTTARR